MRTPPREKSYFYYCRKPINQEEEYEIRGDRKEKCQTNLFTHYHSAFFVFIGDVIVNYYVRPCYATSRIDNYRYEKSQCERKT